MAAAQNAPDLHPDDIAERTFTTHFRGYDTNEVKSYLQSVADAQRALLARIAAAEAIETKATDLISAAEVRAAELLREAQDEARRIVEAVAGEREKAFAEGAARAEAVLAEAEAGRARIEEEARLEGARLVAEAKAARHRVLDDLRRRRKASRVQVEQLNAARERLLAALAEVRSSIDATTTGLRDVMPEVKTAADAAARRVGAEDDTSIEQLEAEIDALKLAGLSLLPSEAAQFDDAGIDDAGVEAVEPGLGSGGDTDPADEVEPGVRVEAAGVPGAARSRSEPADLGAGRRSTSVRIVRPMQALDPETGLPEEPLVPLEAPDPDETVRLVTAAEVFDIEGRDAEVEQADGAAEQADGGAEAGIVVVEEWEGPDEAAVAEAAEAADAVEAFDAADDATPAVGAEPGADGAVEGTLEVDGEGVPVEETRPSAEAVDALFARLKAGRKEHAGSGDVSATPDEGDGGAATAENGPPAEEPAEVAAEDTGEESVEGAVDGAVEESVDGGEAPAGPVSARDELLARRDATLEPATKALNRHLKRLLAEEQNELLDRLRRKGTKAALPEASEHDAAWAEASSSELALAAAAGAAFPGVRGAVKQPALDDLVAVAEALADGIARPLRERLAQAIEEADGDSEVAVDAVRATYRTWRSERLGPGVDHAVLDAFALGVATAFGAGTSVVWLVDDGAQACPDCDDDALAGALPCGEAFPTGHRRPPAHPGCRCLLVAADDPVALAEGPAGG